MDYEQEPQQAAAPRPRRSGFNLGATLGQLSQPRYLALAAGLAGILLGWLVIGWWLYPVEFIDGAPVQLRADYREDYLRAAIDSYTANPDEAVAQRRLDSLGSAVDETMASVAATPGNQSVETIAHFQTMIGLVVAQPTSAPAQGAGGGVGDGSGQTDSGVSMTSAQRVLPVLCGMTVVIGLALAGITLLRRRQAGGERPAALKARDYTRTAERTDYDVTTSGAPLSQWMTTYLMGDDLFDDSFSIDSPAGEFMGECGVGIAETIGVGTPKRVTAFEIWLFDKNDIQTVTKVLMSAHVFREDATRNRLSTKGEPVLCSPGVETVLETETLQMVARVVDMQYGEGALPEESFFEKVTLELAAWSKK
jgi:hypothetical protein